MANGVRYGLAASVFSRGRRPRAVGGQEAGVRHRLGERAPLPARLGDAARRLQGVRLRQGHVALLDGGVHPHQACRGETLLTVDVSAAMRSAPAVDRSRLEGLVARELERFAESNPQSRQLFERAKRLAARRRADELDGEVGRGLPALPPRGDRRAGRRRRRPRVRGLLPRRHRCDGRARAAGDGRGRRRSGGPRRHGDASERGRDRCGRGAVAPLRAARLAVHALRDGCQPLRAPAGAGDHAASEDPRLRLLLPRHRRRDIRDAGRRPGRCARRQRRSAGRPGADHEGRPVERRRRAGAGARARRRRVRARRAGADEHRHRPARAWFPRRAA